MKRELSKILAPVAAVCAFGAVAQTDLAWKYDDTQRPSFVVTTPASDYTVTTALLFPFWTEGWCEDGIRKNGLILFFK